jgi:hypothetical protein
VALLADSGFLARFRALGMTRAEMRAAFLLLRWFQIFLQFVQAFR